MRGSPPDPPAPALETLWTLARGDGVTVSARLFVRGEWGFEAQILHNGQLFVGQRFGTRGQAERWIDGERRATENAR